MEKSLHLKGLLIGEQQPIDVSVNAVIGNTGHIVSILLTRDGKTLRSLQMTNGKLLVDGEETGIVLEP